MQLFKNFIFDSQHEIRVGWEIPGMLGIPVVNDELRYIIIYSDFLDCNIHIINAEKNCHIPVRFYSPCFKNMTYTYPL